ncbi:hypothetical protein QTN47_18005 [Danxiaibacter flavus]|uniref:Uncharacterized protein n=1 Tax=Danxiaibacter flavus TaxID=3049108 RepID=A0ABV3ZHN6_9BACT|nr:hypothetical protein QNM32_18015 [Chitinophagaceae bacterium DXS]
MKYDVNLSMDDDGHMKMTLVDKQDGSMVSFGHSSYSSLIAKSYSHLLKQVKPSLQKRIRE